MKERGMLFSAPMVRALLDGSKTQTRRTVKLSHTNPLGRWEVQSWGGPSAGCTPYGHPIPFQQVISHSGTGEIVCCPYGQPGDRLWVREAWAGPLGDADILKAARGGNERFKKPEFCRYAADGWPRSEFVDADENLQKRWTPAIRMARWASRITLTITEVRVERLQDISGADCCAEGAAGGPGAMPDHPYVVTPRQVVSRSVV